ncbi:hypothetical protein D3C74_107230 [compost metagenome]
MINQRSSIRSVLHHEIEARGYTLHSLSNLTGINRGTLSSILNGNPPKPISIGQLDLMTEALELPTGALYPLFVDECIEKDQLNRRRLKSFLLRCAELGEMDCINRVLEKMLEDLNYVPTIFAIGEQLYEEGYKEASLAFYKAVIESEKYQHSERLAISQYRLFRLSLGEDTEKNIQAAIRFEPYRNRLPEGYHLDGLLNLANVYYTHEKWNVVEVFADELLSLSQMVYRSQNNMKVTNEDQLLSLERHLVVYYGQGYLLKGAALEFQGKYIEAQQCIKGYSDLSWFEGLDEIGYKEVRKFNIWAKANWYNIELLCGNKHVLPEYIEFLKNYPFEILPSMTTIVKAANIHSFSVDDCLQEFQIDHQLFNQINNYYVSLVNKNHYLELCYYLGIYCMKKKDYAKALSNILSSLRFAVSLNNKDYFMKNVALFEHHRYLASSDQLLEYDFLMKEVLEGEEVDLGICAHC